MSRPAVIGRVAQQARNLSFCGALAQRGFLIHDRDAKFTAAFRFVLRGSEFA